MEHRGHRRQKWEKLSRGDREFVKRKEKDTVGDPFCVAWFESICIWNGRQCVWAVVDPDGQVWKQGGKDIRPPRNLTDYARDMNTAYEMGQGIKTSKYVLEKINGS